MRAQRPSAMTGLQALASICLAAALAGAAPPPPTRAVLHLGDGGLVPGALEDSDRPGLLRWRGEAFTAPFEFNLMAVNAIHTPAVPRGPRAEGDFRFEMAGGSVVFGALVDLDANEAVLDLARFGRLRVRRNHLLRIESWKRHSDLIYLGPNGLSEWKTTPADTAKDWREESGELLTSHQGTALQADLGLPARAVVEFEVSWKLEPDFVLALGVGDDEKTARSAFRFEVWESDLVVLRETEEADVASLATLKAGAGRAHFRAYLDQEKGRIVVATPEGKTLADLSVHERKPRVLTGVRLENKHGDVRLERLEISRWNGDPPTELTPDRHGLRRDDGSTVPGEVASYDAATKEFVVRDGDKETRVPLGEVARATLAPPAEGPARSVRVVYQDGSRFVGDLLKVEEGALILAIPGASGPARLPLDGLRSLFVTRQGELPSVPVTSKARLEIDGARLTGHLVDGRNAPGASCLTWQPNGSATASPLRREVSGRIVYKDAPTPTAQPASSGNRIAVQRVMIGGVQRGPFGGMMPGQAVTPARSYTLRRSLHLRTGDVIPCEVTAIDEAGVTFKSALSKNTFVANEKIKAVELADEPAVTVRLNKSKRERLLTLPRVQKGSPPTHLIRSTNGDFLRGRLIRMDDKMVDIEVRLETKTVPRARVSRIIWLHPEEAKAAQAPAERDEAMRVQAVRSDGVRLTFTPEAFEDGTLSGKSDVLGACRIGLKDVDQILIGAAIEQEASRLAYQRWVLTDAPEPKVVQDDTGGSPNGRTPGTESALVGKPAPDFELDLLGGKTFHLAGSKGKVVVLDFWATWCGPCLQAMPQVERVAEEFRDRGVELIAVNLQEAPKDITAMLERHKLKLTVALDRDGVVAERYKANAIPQTVVIDREGNIARLFIGGGPHLGDQLRDALKAALPAP